MVDTIPEILTEKDCYKILERHTDNTVEIVSYEIVKAHSKVIGYLGDHFRLSIIYKNFEKLEKETFFLKTIPIFNARQTEYVTESGLFKKESSIYVNLLPKLSAICGMYFSPRCYIIKENCMVFEDLITRNFRMRGPYLNLQESESLIKCLAKFHSASIIYEELNSINGKTYRLNDEFVEELQETGLSFIEGKPRNKWLKNVTKCVIDCIRLIPNLENPDKIIEKFEWIVSNQLENFIGASTKFRNVVTHCDLWSNNFMINDNFECVLVDFQLVRYNPPAYDLLLTIFLNATREFLDENFENLLDLYYETFCNMLLRYKLVPEDIFPKEIFKDSVEYFKIPTLLEATFFITNTLISPETSTFILSDPERFQEFSLTNRSKYVIEEFKSNEFFRRGLLQTLLPLLDLLQKHQI